MKQTYKIRPGSLITWRRTRGSCNKRTLRAQRKINVRPDGDAEASALAGPDFIGEISVDTRIYPNLLFIIVWFSGKTSVQNALSVFTEGNQNCSDSRKRSWRQSLPGFNLMICTQLAHTEEFLIQLCWTHPSHCRQCNNSCNTDFEWRK